MAVTVLVLSIEEPRPAPDRRAIRAARGGITDPTTRGTVQSGIAHVSTMSQLQRILGRFGKCEGEDGSQGEYSS